MEMTSYDGALTASAPGALLPYRRDSFDADRDWSRWIDLLLPCGTGSGGSTTHIAGAMVRWSSPHVIVDRADRAHVRTAPSVAEGRTVLSSSTPTTVRLRELGAAFSLNKTQLASVLRVSRPTIYAWLQGAEPEAAGLDRIDRLCQLLERAGASSIDPLNARFVRRVVPGEKASLLQLLAADPLDEPVVLDAIEHVRGVDRTGVEERRTKEARLQKAGFDVVDASRRRDQLAESVALRDWPR